MNTITYTVAQSGKDDGSRMRRPWAARHHAQGKAVACAGVLEGFQGMGGNGLPASDPDQCAAPAGRDASARGLGFGDASTAGARGILPAAVGTGPSRCAQGAHIPARHAVRSSRFATSACPMVESR